MLSMQEKVAKVEAVVGKLPLNMQALWFGGPPGDSFINWKNSLAKIGINVKAQYSTEGEIQNRKQIIDTDLLIINFEYIGHNGQDHAKDLAKKYQVPWVYTGNNLSELLTNLEAKKLLPPGWTASKLRDFMEGKEATAPVKLSYLETLTALINKTMNVNSEQLQLLVKFFGPEIASEKQSLFQNYFVKHFNLPDMTHEELCQHIVDIGTQGSLSLSSWLKANKDEKKWAYYQAACVMFRLVTMDLIERVESAESKIVTDAINFVFRLTSKGMLIFNKIREQKEEQEMAAVAPTHRPKPITSPAVMAQHPVLAAPANEIIASHKAPAAPAPVPTIQAVPTPALHIPAAEIKSGQSSLPRANFKTAVTLLFEAAKEEHPEYQSIYIDLKTREIRTKKVVVQEDSFTID